MEPRMSGRVFQGIILQMKEATDRTIGVLDNTGTIISCSELPLIGKKRDEAAAALNASDELLLRFGGGYLQNSLHLRQPFRVCRLYPG